jgi:hypothetical protein
MTLGKASSREDHSKRMQGRESHKRCNKSLDSSAAAHTATHMEICPHEQRDRLPPPGGESQGGIKQKKVYRNTGKYVTTHTCPFVSISSGPPIAFFIQLIKHSLTICKNKFTVLFELLQLQ